MLNRLQSGYYRGLKRPCGCQAATPRSGGERETGEGASRALVSLIDKILASGVPRSALRVNRRQVHGAAGTAVSGQRTKPDLSYVRGTRRYNIEIDTNANQSRNHERDIIANGTRDRTYFLIVDPVTGAIQNTRVYEGAGAAARPIQRFRLRESEFESATSAPRCGCPFKPVKGQFTHAGGGHAWYTPKRDGRGGLQLAACVLRKNFQVRGLSRSPTTDEIRRAWYEIQNDECNWHIRGKMFLPRVSPNRCTGRGIYYASIYIPYRVFNDSGKVPSGNYCG